MTRAELDSVIPSIDGINLNEELLSVIENHELMVIHEEKQPSVDATELSGRYVSGVVCIDRPVDDLTERITDFASHPNYVELYDEVTVLEQNENYYRVKYRAEVEMALLTLNAEFTLDYHRHEDHEWLWSCHGGDVETYRGRLELIPVGPEKTLLGITSWIDLSGVSWLLDTVFWAQPDLHVTLPATLTAILLHGFHTGLSAESPMDSDAIRSSEPEPPTLDHPGINPGRLSSLLDRGTVLVLHPRRRITTSDGPYDLLYTTGLRRMPVGVDRARNELSDFESYPEFIDQVDTVEDINQNDTLRSKWSFRLGLGLLSIPISFTIDYRWDSENRLSFRQTQGQFDLISGCLEWRPSGDSESIYAVTSGSYIDSSAPRLIRLANLIPYREIFMGTTLSTVILQKSARRFQKN